MNFVDHVLRLSLKQRVLILAALALIYILLFPLLVSGLGIAAARSASVVVIVAGGGLLGLVGGLLTALLMSGVFSVLILLGQSLTEAGEVPLSPLMILAALLVGSCTGYLSQHLRREVAAQQHREERLKDYERRYLGFFNQITDGILVTDLQLKIVDANRQALKLLGYATQELIGKSLETLFLPEYVDHAVTQILKDTNLIFEQTLVTQAGEQIPVEVSVQRVYDEAQQPVQIQCLVRDIRERKYAEQDHLKLEAERQRVNIINQFVRDASHDFRTPLSVITTSAYLMVRNPEPENIKDRASIINQQVRQIDNLLDNMMAMMRLDEQHDVFTDPVEVNTVLQQVYNAARSAAETRSISLDLALDPDVPVIYGNDTWLEMAFARLLTNAIQFNKPGGSVILRSLCKPDWIAVEFRDTGLGIAPENLPRIWESFYREDKARSSASGGSGLGLTIVQKIIQQHNGQIRVDSKVGQGSTFTVLLPLS